MVEQKASGGEQGDQTVPRPVPLQRTGTGPPHPADARPAVGEGMMFVREPDAGNPHVRFDEGDRGNRTMVRLLRHRAISLLTAYFRLVLARADTKSGIRFAIPPYGYLLLPPENAAEHAADDGAADRAAERAADLAADIGGDAAGDAVGDRARDLAGRPAGSVDRRWPRGRSGAEDRCRGCRRGTPPPSAGSLRPAAARRAARPRRGGGACRRLRLDRATAAPRRPTRGRPSCRRSCRSDLRR